ncbi:MAG: hypothetical protein OES64_06740, partial [Desulfobacteraceae bacterium]|nr:hypothetical protein [Desulfobacteraceae bacterium]
MKKNLILFLIMINIALLIPGKSIADEVRLKNGDKLTGQIIRMQDDKLILKTTYAGEITITWQEVAGIRADGSVKIVLKDETTLEGTTEAVDDGKMKLDM